MRTIAILFAAAALSLAGGAAAQFPQRPVHIVVTVPPGGAPDIVARLLAEKLPGALGQPVVVDNKPGANGYLAAAEVARSEPDGHTLLLTGDSLLVINPHLYRRAPLDVQRELAPVAALARSTFVLVVHPALPAGSLAEFIAHARRAAPPLAYGAAGHGSQHHLTMERLKREAGIELLRVPYRGGAAAVAATVAGEVQATIAGASAAPLVRAGKLRAIAVTGAARSPFYPGTPAIAETFPGFEVAVWLGLFGPALLPEAARSRIREAVTGILASPETARRLGSVGGLQPLLLSPAEFQDLIRRESAHYGALVKRIGLEPE